MTRSPPQPASRKWLLVVVPIACLFIGAALTALLSYHAWRGDVARAREHLRQSAAPVAHAIQRVLDRHAEIVQATAGLFYASDRVTRNEFRRFTLGPLEAHPSIQALAWIARVPDSERSEFERRAREEGVAGFTITELGEDGRLRPATRRDEYFPITFIEPRRAGESAFGFDFGSEAVRRAALTAAIARGESTASAPTSLIGEGGHELAILLLNPVYDNQRRAADAAERGAHLLGFTLSAIRVSGLVAEALEPSDRARVAFRLRDVTLPDHSLSLYASEAPGDSPGAISASFGEGRRWNVALRVPGRRWVATFVSAQDGSAGYGLSAPLRVLGVGSVMTLLVAVSVLLLMRRSFEIEALAASLDDTNRALAEENSERRLAEETINAFFEHTLVMLAIADMRDNRLLRVNSEVLRVTGRTREELLSRPLIDLVHPEDRAATIAAMSGFAEGRPMVAYRNRHITAGGEIRFLEWNAVPDRTRQLVYAMAQDVTDREKAQADLRDSEERFRELAEHIEEAFWLVDWPGRRVIYASPAYERIWGRSVRDLYASADAWRDAIHPEDRASADAAIAAAVAEGVTAPAEYRILRPDGAVRWVAEQAFPVRNPSGETVRIAGVARDITTRKEYEEEKRQLQAKMLHAQKLESLGVLAGGIAHDFNNLLMSIMGNADLALRELAPEDPAREFVARIEKATARAGELTDQMLAYSGKGQFVVEPVRMSRLVQEMVHLLETVVSKKAILTLDLATYLPAIEADATQLRQVVMNLITNASEALGEDQGNLRVSTGVIDADRAYLAGCVIGEELPEGRYVYIEVADTGCGMSPITVRRIFDPFFTTRFTGRGLGLAAVLGIVKGHRGAIRVDSDRQRGSTFRVLIPALESGAPQPEEARTETAPETAMGEATVLIVDDDPGVLEVAREMVEHVGLRAITATNGLDGVEMLRSHRDEVSVVLLDMSMPGMSGDEAFTEMRRIRGDVPVILSSGYSELDTTSRVVGEGLAGFLQKPYVLAELVKRIGEAIGR